MYEDKYGEADIADMWVFENCTIRLQTERKVEQHVELIPDRANLNLRNPDNYFKQSEKAYFVSESVTYEDYHIKSEMEKYFDQEKARKDSLMYTKRLENQAQTKMEEDQKRKEIKEAFDY